MCFDERHINFSLRVLVTELETTHVQWRTAERKSVSHCYDIIHVRFGLQVKKVSVSIVWLFLIFLDTNKYAILTWVKSCCTWYTIFTVCVYTSAVSRLKILIAINRMIPVINARLIAYFFIGSKSSLNRVFYTIINMSHYLLPANVAAAC